MALIHPFKAYKPDPDTLSEVACLPYDVVSAEEARRMAEGKPHSFLHVVRPEIDLPEGTPFNDDRVYERGARNLGALMNEGILKRDSAEAIYLYQLIRSGRSQTGIFSCVSVDEYDRDLIRRHELTRPDKEDDRTRHILTQSAHSEPVMLTFKPRAAVRKLMQEARRNLEPEFDFEADDGVRHTLWRVEQTSPWVNAFGEVPLLYIADGHHRCKSASRAAEALETETGDAPVGKEDRGAAGGEGTGNGTARRTAGGDGHGTPGEHRFFPAVIFPMDEMEILPYNRLVHRVPEDLMETLKTRFDAERTDNPAPQQKGFVCLYTGDGWWRLELPIDGSPGSVEKLDVHRLQKHLLEPLLGITDPRRDTNLSFVGGIRGTEELERRVDSGEAELAVSMYPTGIEELVAVSDAGKLMPPKSTWFEPKLRSGLLVHTF